MAKGDTFHDTPFSYTDSYSGRTITQLTDYLGHSNHLYFTDPCWLRGQDSFIFTSDREGASNLFSFDLATNTIRQLTDLTRDKDTRPAGCFSAANNCHYFWWGRQIIELNVETLAERIVYELPDDMEATDARPGITADGRYICTRIMKDEGATGPNFAYARFRELFAAKPFSQILRIEIASGNTEVIHEDYCFITHENPSPTLPHIMTFCHEGPWDLVEQRIWGLNILTGEVWKLRDQTGANIAIGHEYWLANGTQIGYHGRLTDGHAADQHASNHQSHHIYGYMNWDGSERSEHYFPFASTHFCSLDASLIVGDGTAAAVFSQQGDAQPFIQLFNWNGRAFEEARVLAYHRSTFNDQHAHCHPRFTPDGKYIMYASDMSRYANIYLVEVGDLNDLPSLQDVPPPRHT
ncbi:MAG: oligogalacturonate lyase family protein [Deinococcota bacterium]